MKALLTVITLLLIAVQSQAGNLGFETEADVIPCPEPSNEYTCLNVQGTTWAIEKINRPYGASIEVTFIFKDVNQYVEAVSSELGKLDDFFQVVEIVHHANDHITIVNALLFK